MAHLEDLDLQHVKGDDIAPTAMALALATQLLNKRDDAAGYRVASVGVVGDSVFKGLNVDHFAGTCAEMIVLGSAEAAESTPTHIVAMGNRGKGVVNPCGRCRQVMCDLYPHIRVIVASPVGIEVVHVQDLLPYPYRLRSKTPAPGAAR